MSLQLRMSRSVQFYQRCLLLPLQALKRNISVDSNSRASRINHAATHLHLEKLLEVSGVGVGEEFGAVVDERLWRVVRRHDDLQQARAAHTSHFTVHALVTGFHGATNLENHLSFSHSFDDDFRVAAIRD